MGMPAGSIRVPHVVWSSALQYDLTQSITHAALHFRAEEAWSDNDNLADNVQHEAKPNCFMARFSDEIFHKLSTDENHISKRASL